MDEQCCVDGCYSVKEELYYFKLPVSRTLRKRWVDAINSSAKLTDDALVCSRHFQEEQYMFVRGKRRLKPKVVPCLFERKEAPLQNVEHGTEVANEPNIEMDIDKKKTSRKKKNNKCAHKASESKDFETDEERIEGDKSSSPDGSAKSPRSVKETLDLEFSPNKDIEDIITNYHIKQTRPLSEITERDPSPPGAEADAPGRDPEAPQYVEISVGGKSQDQTEDCLMLLENVQVEVDPSMFLDQDHEDLDRANIEQVDLDQDSGSDCIDLGEKKNEPISLLSSSDEDEVIIQEPHIDTITVSDATDEDDIPLLRLLKRHKKRKCEKSAAITKILANKHTAADASAYSQHMSRHTHMIHMCETCNYHTSSWLLMHRHKEKHTRESKNTRRRNREKKYKCPLCTYRAKHNMSLVYHMGTHGTKVECDKCGYFSDLKENVAKHMKDCKSEFSCGLCSYRTNSKGCYSKHMKRFHDDGGEDEEFVPTSWS